MHMDDMILLSIDDHIIEPPDLFDDYIPEKFKSQAPVYRPGAGPNARGAWIFQGQETGNPGLGCIASWPHDEWGWDPVGYEEMRPAVYDIELRVRDMDANGQFTAMCFPTFPGFNGMSLANSTIDRELSNVVIAAYNDWHIEQLAEAHPGRFLPLAIVPVYDPASMV